MFLGVYLYREDFIKWPVIYDHTTFLISILFLFVGFFLQAVNWRQILKSNYPISIRDAIVSSGLSVFTKYIPGKVLVILGKAEFITKKYSYPRKEIIARSLESQLITIWTGLLVGSLSLSVINVGREWFYLIFISLLALGVIIFNHHLTLRLSSLLSKAFKRQIDLPKMSAKVLIKILPFYFLYWFVYALAFYFLANSLTPTAIKSSIGYIFPLAATAGILAIIAPGGLGVREGVLILFLGSSELMTTDSATTVSVFSRLWFMGGETFLFLIGIIASRKHVGGIQK